MVTQNAGVCGWVEGRRHAGHQGTSPSQDTHQSHRHRGNLKPPKITHIGPRRSCEPQAQSCCKYADVLRQHMTTETKQDTGRDAPPYHVFIDH